MEINDFSKIYQVSNNKIQSQKEVEQQKEATTSQTVVGKSPANPAFYGSYQGISFKGKTVDNTNFRTDLEKRAEVSATSLKIYPDLKHVNDKDKIRVCNWADNGTTEEFKLYKTKHHEYVQSKNGEKIYKVRYVDNKDRISQLVFASKLYNCVGVRTPEYIPFEKDGKSGYLVEILEEKLEPQETNPEALYYSFVADAWLGNRNGLSKDNTKIDKDGNPVKLSVSGALGYRASGKPKDKKFDYEIDELKTMRDYSKNPDAAAALSSMTDEQLYAAIEKFKQKAAQNYSVYSNIGREYYSDKTVQHDVGNVVTNRVRYISEFVQKDKNEKIMQRRGFYDGKTSAQATNMTELYQNEYILKITDEQWQTLKDRNLLQKRWGLKPLSDLDYTYLAEMTDEEHKTALKRNLYAPCEGDDEIYKKIGGIEIAGLSQISDEDWEIVKSRKLLNAKEKHDISEFFLDEFVKKAVTIAPDDWGSVEYTGFYDIGINNKDLDKFVEIRHDPQNRNMHPSFDFRVSRLCGIERKLPKYKKELKSEYVLAFAGATDEQWKRIEEMTNNFTELKLKPHVMAELCNFTQEEYEILKKRGFINEAYNAYGLDKIAALTDEEWENLEKRGLRERFPNDYHSWSYLCALSDDEFQLATDKKLFEKRGKRDNDYFDGEEISVLVNTMSEKDWENFEKRGLLKDYYVFDDWGYSNPNSNLAITLSKYSDNEFDKYNEITQAPHSYIYPSTITDLVKLPEEQYQRLMDRHLFKYMNSYEAYDDYIMDAPVMRALAELDDEEYNTFLNQKNECKTIAAKTLIIKADKLGLSKKQSVSELNSQQKRDYLKLMITKGNVLLYKDFQENYPVSGIIPKNIEEYKEIMKELIKSVGVYTKPLDETTKTQFFNAIDKICSPNSDFAKLDLKAYDFKLDLKYPRKDFISDVSNLVKNLDVEEKRKVWDYFGFELASTPQIDLTMFGYPTLINNGEKLKEIENPQTKAVIEQIRPLVKKFTEENSIQCGKHINPEMATTLNDIFNAMPELYTIVGKKQHGTHDYDVDVHSLAVLQECVKNPAFELLSKKEKQMMVFTALLHDITKEENSIDKAHPQNSGYDAYFLLEKFGLPRTEHLEIYQLIKNHDMLEQCNKKTYDNKLKDFKPISEDEQNRKIQQYAYEFRSGNLGKMACIFTKSDLLSVKRDGRFWDKYGSTLSVVSKKLDKEIKAVKKTSIILPQTKIPNASKLTADGVDVVEKTTYDKDGNAIKNKVVNMKKGIDLSKNGFEKGVTDENFNVIIHGFANELDNITLDALELADQDALLSASYVVYEKGNYHAFRPYGVIKETPFDNIGAAYFRDFGSGCKKNVEQIVNSYINGSNSTYRDYIPKLIKKNLNLSDEQYINLYDDIKDKPLEEIEQEKPYLAHALRDIFKEMEIHKRKFNRDYNEILIGNAKTTGIFYQGKKADGTKLGVEDIPEFLRKYAQDNDLPIIYFGE